MTGLVFLHGWGFGPEAWSPWAEAFPERPVALLDAGYYGPKRYALPPCPDGWIGIGHSLGFARLLAMDIPWRGLLGFGGFLRFCAPEPTCCGVPHTTVDAMIDRLEGDPTDVLRRFLRRCGMNGMSPRQPTAEGLSRLRRDLLFLRGPGLSAPAGPPPTLLIHAADDRIVPLSLAEETCAALKGARLATLERGGHALPFLHMESCLSMCREFLHGLP